MKKQKKPRIKVKRRRYTFQGERINQTKTYFPPKEAPKPKPSEAERSAAVGRPPMLYNEDTAAYIITCIATSTKSLRTIVSENPEFPSVVTIFKWLNENEEFAKRYAVARDQQKAAMYDDMLHTMNETQMGEIKIVRSKGTGPNRRIEQEVKQRDMTEHRRLKIDTIKWTLAKLDPSRYGDKIILDDRRDTLADVLKEMRAQHDKETAEGQQRFPEAPDPDTPVPSESQVTTPPAAVEPQEPAKPEEKV